MLRLSKQTDGRILVIFPNEFRLEDRMSTKQRILAEVEKGETEFIFDFSQTTVIDSCGLGVLVSLSKKVRDRGGSMIRIRGLNDEYMRIMTLTKMSGLFDIEGIEAFLKSQRVPAA